MLEKRRDTQHVSGANRICELNVKTIIIPKNLTMVYRRSGNVSKKKYYFVEHNLTRTDSPINTNTISVFGHLF